METRTDNEIIAEFMGLQAVRIGYYGTDDETEFQVKYKDWLDKPEIVEQYDNSIGDYYVNIKKDLIISQDSIRYSKDWNDLMPVVAKINRLKPKNDFFLGISILKARLPQVYKATVEFCRWYTSNQPQKAS